MSIINRKQYMENTSWYSHREYYSQFVTEQTKNHISSYFTKDELAEALKEDKHLNSIKLSSWDHIVARRTIKGPGDRSFAARLPIDRKTMADAGEPVTLSTLVCIAKEAARMIVEDT